MPLGSRRSEVSIERDGDGFVVGYFEPDQLDEAQALADRIAAALSAPYHVRLKIIYFERAHQVSPLDAGPNPGPRYRSIP